MDVLLNEDERVVRCKRLEVAPPGVVERVTPDALVGADGQQCRQRPGDRRIAGTTQLGHAGLELGLRRGRRIVVEDLRVGLDGVGEGRVRGLGVGEAPALPPIEDLREPVEVLLELPGQSRLADPGRADDRHQVRTAFRDHPAHGLLEQGDLLVPPDERRFDAQRRADAATSRLDRHGPPGGDRQRLALEHRRRQLLVIDDVARGGVGEGPDHDGTRQGDLLQPRSRIDRVAGHDPVTLAAGPPQIDQHLPGLDPDPQAQLGVAFATQLAGQLDHGSLHLECRPDGALGVDLMDGRDPEDGQHRVAGELLDQALVARDLRAQAIECARHQRLHELGVGGLIEAGEADQVGEDHGRDLALPARIRRGDRRARGTGGTPLGR